MIEHRTLPRIDGMTLLAVTRKTSLDMTRRRGRVEIGRVTTIAVRRKSGKLISDMALVTVLGGMPSSQSKEIMIEYASRPGVNGMTGLAICG